MKVIKKIGQMEVCERPKEQRSPVAPRFVVRRGDRILEEFGKYSRAVKWARENKAG